MKLGKNLNNEVRNIFESEKYFGKTLSDKEVIEIANNLVTFAEIVIDIVKIRSENEF